ncbi:MAG: hypothetical protein FWD89_05210, partial [Firmicutes bacterium]|nr:hypothetical protein [Bacillota bacterium]
MENKEQKDSKIEKNMNALESANDSVSQSSGQSIEDLERELLAIEAQKHAAQENLDALVRNEKSNEEIIAELEAELMELEMLEAELAALLAGQSSVAAMEDDDTMKPVREEYLKDEKAVSFGDYQVKQSRVYKRNFFLVVGAVAAVVIGIAAWFIIQLIPPETPSDMTFTVVHSQTNRVSVDRVPMGEKEVYYTRGEFFVTALLRDDRGRLYTGNNRTVTLASPNAVVFDKTTVTSGEIVRVRLGAGVGEFATIRINAISQSGNIIKEIDIFIDNPVTDLKFDVAEGVTANQTALRPHDPHRHHDNLLDVQGATQTKLNHSTDRHRFFMGEYATFATRVYPSSVRDGDFSRPTFYQIVPGSMVAAGNNPNNEPVVRIAPDGQSVIANFPGTVQIRAVTSKWLFNTNNRPPEWTGTEENETNKTITLTVEVPPIRNYLLNDANRRPVAFFGTQVDFGTEIFQSISGEYDIKRPGEIIGSNVLTHLPSILVGGDWWQFTQENPHLGAVSINTIEGVDSTGRFINTFRVTPPNEVADWDGFPVAITQSTPVNFPYFELRLNRRIALGTVGAPPPVHFTGMSNRIEVNLSVNTQVKTQVVITPGETQRILNINTFNMSDRQFFEFAPLRLDSLVEIQNLNIRTDEFDFDVYDVHFEVGTWSGSTFNVDHIATQTFIHEVDGNLYFIPISSGTFHLRAFLVTPFSVHTIGAGGQPFTTNARGTRIANSESEESIRIDVNRVGPELTPWHEETIRQNFLDILGEDFWIQGSTNFHLVDSIFEVVRRVGPTAYIKAAPFMDDIDLEEVFKPLWHVHVIDWRELEINQGVAEIVDLSNDAIIIDNTPITQQILVDYLNSLLVAVTIPGFSPSQTPVHTSSAVGSE